MTAAPAAAAFNSAGRICPVSQHLGCGRNPKKRERERERERKRANLRRAAVPIPGAESGTATAIIIHLETSLHHRQWPVRRSEREKIREQKNHI